MTCFQMANKYLPKFELKDGFYYAGECRNASVAVWDAQNHCFWYMRTKFRDTFFESIRHPEDDDGHDLFYPVVEALPTDDQKVDLVTARASLRSSPVEVLKPK